MKLPSFALGTWSMGGSDSWGYVDDKASVEALDYALDHGVTWIDTAPAYGNGSSEKLLGRYLKGRDRSKLIITSKCGLTWEEEGSMVHKCRDGVTVYRNLTPASIRRQVEAILQRLDTDYLDICLTHHQNPNDSLEETIGCLEELKKEGKIREYGACNVNREQLERYLELGSPVLIQNRFSALYQKDKDLARYASEKGVYFQAYSPMERGILTGGVKPGAAIEGSAKNSDRWYNPEAVALANSRLNDLRDMADNLGMTLSSLALTWTSQTLKGGGVCAGPRKVRHMEEALRNYGKTLTEEDYTRYEETIDTILMEAEAIWQ